MDERDQRERGKEDQRVNAILPRPTGTLVQLAVRFRLETSVTAQEIVDLLRELAPLREENFHLGQRGSGAKFDPDFDTISKLMLNGTMRWITARSADGVIGLQQWALVPHLWSRGMKLALCDSIIGGRRRGIDIVSFVQYGVQAMRALGAHRIYFSPPVSSSFESVIEELGGQRIDVVMEMP